MRKVRKRLGGDIVIVDKLGQSLLKEGIREQIVCSVEIIIDEMKDDNRIIFSTSDSLIKDTPVENIRLAFDTAFKTVEKVFKVDRCWINLEGIPHLLR